MPDLAPLSEPLRETLALVHAQPGIRRRVAAAQLGLTVNGLACRVSELRARGLLAPSTGVRGPMGGHLYPAEGTAPLTAVAPVPARETPAPAPVAPTEPAAVALTPEGIAAAFYGALCLPKAGEGLTWDELPQTVRARFLRAGARVLAALPVEG
jgi:hypothetical protein